MKIHVAFVFSVIASACTAGQMDLHRIVDAVYARLTPEERVAQICATTAGNLAGSDGRFSAEKARARIPHGIGHVCQFACNRTDEPDELARFVRDVQEFCMNETSSGIPAICHEEVISGLAARTAATYPQQIGIAASWDAALLEKKCRETSEAMRAVGATFALSPMADVIVNSNWTRLEEGYGESGYLAAVMGTAFVRGLQASGNAAACTKHFLGYGVIGGGHDRSWRDIYEEVIYPHEAMINAGGAAAVMTSYDSFKGEQAVSSPTLIQHLLRGYIGFDGTVVSDYGAVEWGVRDVKDPEEKKNLMKLRAAAAIKAGNDVDLPHGAAYQLALECVKEGLVTEAELEKSVKNSLMLKARLGLIGDSKRALSAAIPPRSDGIDLDRPEWRETALQLARESVVLLQNDGTLPIKKGKKIALVGPNANSAWAMLGDYTYQCMQAFWRRNPREWEKPHIVTFKEGMESVFGAGSIVYSRGCGWSNPGDTGVSAGGDPRTEALSLKLVDSADPTDFSSAVKAGRSADVIVCAMGENFTLCGESRQRASIRLAGDQERLVEAMLGTGKPVVLVLFGGRNQVISSLRGRCAAVLQAWYPGEEGGRAVAEILAGDVNPSAKLPMTYPKTESRSPLHFGDGSDTPDRVEWPFGFGMSYTKFAYGDAEVVGGSEKKIGSLDDSVAVAFSLKNAGAVDGTEVVQLYITAKNEPVRLRGFERVALKPGESRRVEFSLPLGLFARWRGGREGEWIVEPGEYELRVASDAWDKSHALRLSLVGNSIRFPRRTDFFAKSCVYDDVAARYIQCRSGEIQLLPALGLDEMRKGHKENLEAVGGFVFNLEWRENKVTRLRVLSKNGGVCRVRSYGAIGSPLMRKARRECPNAAIGATRGMPVPDGMAESCFERRNPLSSVCYDFDTKPGEILEFRGQSGNQDWTSYARDVSDRFLTTPEAARIAQNVLDWQLDSGGWPKNVPMHNPLSSRERTAVLSMKGDRKLGTIDNAATFCELRFLSRMYKANSGKPVAQKYLGGIRRGIDFLLGLQYPNGGWPQCDPAKVGYWHQITYNDGAMVNVMKTLRDVYESRAPFDVPVPNEMREKCRAAFDRGVECILDTQIRQDGVLALWCQQHDRETLEPCAGRSFELPSVCTYESAGIAMLLMSLDADRYPPETARRIRESIEGAVRWYGAHAMLGYAIEDGFRRPDGILTSRLVRIPESASKPLWCRCYTLEDNRPFTGRRDGTKNFDFSDLERGENMSYKWFSDAGTHVAKEYARWTARDERRRKRADMRRTAKTTEWRGGRGSGGVPDVQSRRDTWENPDNWTNGAPQAEDTVVFTKDATIWTMSSVPYECGKIVLRNGADLTLQSHYEANNAVRPKVRPSAIEGDGVITLNRFGLETREGETLVVPASVKISANPKEGSGSWLASCEGGRLVVKGDVACWGNMLSIKGDVAVEGRLEGAERIRADSSVRLLHPPALLPIELACRAGDSLQRVLDLIPEDSPRECVVKVAPGRYREKVRLSGRRAGVRLVADDPRPGRTVVSWNDTPATPKPGGGSLGTFGSATFYVDIPDFEMDGFTIENTGTPERLAVSGGREQAGQCVALLVKGDRNVFRNCRILGWQDTVFAGGEAGSVPARQFFDGCYIEGTVDFIFGGSLALFWNCDIHSIQGGYVTAGSHGSDMPFGYVFAKCRVTCGKGMKTSLGRPWRPYANITFIDSDFGDAVTSAGWSDWTTDFGRRVWRSAEYGCRQVGETKRDAIVEVGGARELRARLREAGCATVFDIIGGADGWRPQRRK